MIKETGLATGLFLVRDKKQLPRPKLEIGEY